MSEAPSTTPAAIADTRPLEKRTVLFARASQAAYESGVRTVAFGYGQAAVGAAWRAYEARTERRAS